MSYATTETLADWETTDKGCSWHPSCLACPRESCRYDEPRPSAAAIARRNRAIVRLARRGVPVQEIARRWRLSRQRAQEIIRQAPPGVRPLRGARSP